MPNGVGSQERTPLWAGFGDIVSPGKAALGSHGIWVEANGKKLPTKDKK